MTRIAAELELHNKYNRVWSVGSDLRIDADELIIFFQEPSEHRDYIMFRAVERSPGNYEIEQCYDAETGMVSVTRVWLTPAEWAAKHHASDGSC